MSRVCLINPALSLSVDLYARGIDTKMPIGLLYLAASLEKHGHQVLFIDAAILGIGAADILNRLKIFNPQFVGISCVSATRDVALELSKLIKNNLSSPPKIILGGVYPSLDPIGCMKENTVDYVVVGEGELVFPVICTDNFNVRNLPGVYYRDKVGVPTISSAPERIIDIDSLPFPAYNHLPLEDYMKNREELYLIASRGCPHECTYCCSPRLWNRNICFRSPENVISEIKTYIKMFPKIKNFHFLDDNFTAWRNGLDDFCHHIKNLNINWRCIGCINYLDQKMISNMSNSGFYAISFGVESGSERIQRGCKKRLELNEIPEKIKLLSSANIRTKAFFMFGFPDETEEELYETIRYSLLLKNYGLDDAVFLPLIPYHGTEIYEKFGERYGKNFGEVEATRDYLGSGPLFYDKLAKYRTFPVISANNEHYTGRILRCISAHAYEIFYSSRSNDYHISELRKFLYNTA